MSDHISNATIDSVHPRFSAKPRRNYQGLKVALVQLSVGKDKTKNVAEAVNQIHLAKEQGAQLVALPECFNSPYGTGFFKEYAEEIPSGETSQALSKAAAEAGVCVVGGTLPERCGNKLYNTCTVWDASGKLLATHRKHFEAVPFGDTCGALSRAAAETGACVVGGTVKELRGNFKYNTCTVWGGRGELLATYRKMHLFDIDIPGQITFRESDVLSAGNQLTTFEYCGVKVGLGICYDLRFPEMAHIMAKQGCSLLIYPGAFNMTTGPKHWELLGRARATDHQLWVALVSPARDQAAGYVAWGHSTLVDPWGQVAGKLDEKPGTLVADIDLATVEAVRSQIPIRSQRRTDVYDTVDKVKQ